MKEGGTKTHFHSDRVNNYINGKAIFINTNFMKIKRKTIFKITWIILISLVAIATVLLLIVPLL